MVKSASQGRVRLPKKVKVDPKKVEIIRQKVEEERNRNRVKRSQPK